MTIKTAQRDLTYESLHHFLMRTNTLRIRLRRSSHALAKIEPLQVQSDGNFRKDTFSIMWDRGNVVKLREVYDDLCKLAQSIENDIHAIEREKKNYIRTSTLVEDWYKKDAAGKRDWLRARFAEGMSPNDDKSLDKVHLRDHFLEIRTIISVAAQDAFCKHLGKFGEGLVTSQQFLFSLVKERTSN